MNTKKIELNESGLSVLFTVSEEGIVELERFAPASGAAAQESSAEDSAGNLSASGQTSGKPSDADPSESEQPPEDAPDRLPAAPFIELQITGKSTRGLHGYRHNSSSASLDLKYVRHEVLRSDAGLELVIFLKSGYGLEAVYHMMFFHGVPAVRVFTELKKHGVAIFFSTHITSDLDKCADDIVYISNGEIVAALPKDEFTAKYAQEGESLEDTILRMERGMLHA